MSIHRTYEDNNRTLTRVWILLMVTHAMFVGWFAATYPWQAVIAPAAIQVATTYWFAKEATK